MRNHDLGHIMLQCVFRCLYNGATASPFNFRLILARMRFESKGGRLPGSSGPIVATPPSQALAGKKRALPIWGGGGGGGGGGAASGRPKKETPPWKATLSPATAPTAPSLFTPSYTLPRSAGKDKADAGATAASAAADARAKSKAFKPWTSDSVMRVIKEAGSSGATVEVRLCASHPRFLRSYFVPSLCRTIRGILLSPSIELSSPARRSFGAWRYLKYICYSLVILQLFTKDTSAVSFSPKGG